MTICYVGLGSNLSQPEQQLRQALSALKDISGVQLLQASSLYRSAPLGAPDQPWYVNAVAQLETSLEPLALLRELQTIENSQGRVRQGERWSPRTLDLDLLLFGEQTIDSEALTVPHYAMHERNFVIFPLAEIAPSCVIPGIGSISALLATLPQEGIERME
ncbi:2-amino-4-hydroxy-6-hydroxymethyldihydropteridine pyrophosphokinase [Hahella chejuensis KCTC 2396]|uniref:2-amino-4-hydroxy-6-hydroxymethyldihydropteridine pyrophosphokinase n=1 Tax=Hahella chejuensis (strain KCTC 2396) TaxID=349521 RepID=Q2S8W4_HAHCH|nr:2-amino-4-hydroxy-6-hydroxymethyldihydropteridine diphosphokinase [Hahella chejuensis]ABC32910.1 2-amino-4-hydroxy-6-hydroxymethyldihydropteridine pyrophosphokinase [Hahella chejuensis KCTC 2396]